MILVDDKVLYIHCPRSGGMYLAKSLKDSGTPHKYINFPHGCLTEKSEYKTVSVIRNPYSWYVSMFIHPITKFGTLRDSFRNCFHFLPNYSYVIENMHKHVDVILRHDNLIEELSNHFGLSIFDDKNVNTEIKDEIDYTEYYTDELRDKVANDCRDIIEKYGFCFGGI